MFEFLTTPIGIWTALMALTLAGFFVGTLLSWANFLFGESLAFYSASAMGAVALFGILPALYLSNITAALEVIGLLMLIIFALCALLIFVMSAAGSTRDY